MATVKEGFEVLKKLVEEGHGDVQLLAFDGQGDTADGSIGNEVREVGESTKYNQGEILDMDEGTKFVPIYMG